MSVPDGEFGALSVTLPGHFSVSLSFPIGNMLEVSFDFAWFARCVSVVASGVDGDQLPSDLAIRDLVSAPWTGSPRS